MRRLLAVTAMFLATALGVSADELVISRGGRRIIDPDPSTAATNCSGWSYDPAPVAFDSDVSTVYSTSGVVQNHCTEAVPFGDQIWLHQRGPNDVFSATPVIDRTNFRWMFGDLPIDPAAYVGRLASPSVVRANGRYFMAFVASVADPGLCAGVHTGNVCAPCSDPWSYYVIYWAMSEDGTTWHLYDASNSTSNIALSNALLYREPNANDKALGSQYRGLTRVRILLADGYVWFLTQFSAQDAMRTVMLRVLFDPSTQWGINGALEAWRGDLQNWQPVTDGVLADDFDNSFETGFYPPIVSMSDVTQFQSERFIGLIPASGTTDRTNTRVDYVLSHDLLSWTPPKPLRSAIPYFADDTGYGGSVVDPTLIEDSNNVLHLLMASNDGDSDHGIARDGQNDCGNPSPPYLGLGIYEGIVDLEPLATTSLAIFPPSNPASAGNVTFDVRVSASNGTSPRGQVTLTVGNSTLTVDLANGRALVTVPLTTLGTYPVHASFTSVGPWTPANADAQIVIVAKAPSRRRAVRH